ncbi:MAG: inositol monophosphatase [Lachnospiraceae bacterium]|nr:inositol monophosphatase [Lachnospiraceae bacterium]
MISMEEAKIIEGFVYEAGQILLSAKPGEAEVYKKDGPANFATFFDVKIQEFLIGKLSERFEGAGFFGEEDTQGNAQKVSPGYTFFIDPIDGTTNFMFDYHNSCVSLGLSEGNGMIGGWVYDPYKDRMFSALRGHGAFLNGIRLHIENRPMSEGIVAFGCARYNEGDRIFSVLKELFMNSLSLRNGGSAAIDLCRIAAGSNIAYVEMKIQPYDYAAASVIIEESGGFIGQADGSPITIDGPCSIVAGTKKAASQIRGILSGAQ